MGLLKKVGLVIILYFVLGVAFAYLLWNGFVNIGVGNILINVLYWLFYPVILFAVIFIFSGLQPLPIT